MAACNGGFRFAWEGTNGRMASLLSKDSIRLAPAPGLQHFWTATFPNSGAAVFPHPAAQSHSRWNTRRRDRGRKHRGPSQGPRRSVQDSPTDSPETHRTVEDRKSTRLNSSHQIISYAVFCLKKKTMTQCRAITL